MSYRYYEAPDRRQFCYATHPTFTCPQSRSLWDYHDLETGDTKVVEREPGERMGVTFTRHVNDRVKHGARQLGMDPDRLAGMIAVAHRRDSGRARIDGKLTDKCKVCGAKMERVGFHCWVERPYTEEELESSSARATVSLNAALGTQALKTIRNLYVDTKKEAREWAYDEFKTAKAAEEEQHAQAGD